VQHLHIHCRAAETLAGEGYEESWTTATRFAQSLESAGALKLLHFLFLSFGMG